MCISQTSFNPENWSFVGGICHYAVSEEYADYGEQIFDDIHAQFEKEIANDDFLFVEPEDARKLADSNGRYAKRGTCDHCGARFNYGAVFKSTDGEHIVLGNICALNKLNLTGQEYTDQRMRKISESARTRAKNDKAFSELPEDLQKALDLNHYICNDIRAKFRQYGSISEAQKELVLKIHAEAPQLARKKAEKEAAEQALLATREMVPVSDERIKFTGKILGIKAVESQFGTTYKMIFQDDRGFKLYGTEPSKVDDFCAYDENGEMRDGGHMGSTGTHLEFQKMTSFLVSLNGQPKLFALATNL
jgi:hypothetical protein